MGCVRVIIDYLREAADKHVKEVLAEKPKYTTGFTPVTFFLYDLQIEFLASHGVKIGTEEEPEKYKDLSKACRAMLDFAMRAEAEGNKDKIFDLFETIRCLNC